MHDEIVEALAALAEQRSEKVGPAAVSSDRSALLWGAQPSLSGVVVNEQTMMTYAAYFSAVRIISEDVAKLGIAAYSRDGESRSKLPDSDPLTKLLKQPDLESDQFGFFEAMQGWGLTWGNGYAEIERSNAGQAIELHMVEPNRVKVDRDKKGRLIYDVANRGQRNAVLDPQDVFHLRGFGNGLVGLSVAGLARESMGLGMAAEQFGQRFFGQGTHLAGVLSHPGLLGEEGIDNLRKGWKEMYSGVGNFAAVAVLEEGMQWNRIGIPPEDAQFLQTRQHQVTEVARWFRLPPHKLADLQRATFSNIEHQSIEYVTDTLLSWAKRIESECDRKLVPARLQGRVFTKMNLATLLRGDLKTRYEAYKIGREIGVLSINDVRAFEDMNPIGPAGDVHTVPLNMTTAEKQAADDNEVDATIVEDDAADQVANKDDKAIGRALKKPAEDFDQWFEEYLAEQRQFLARKLAVVAAVADVDAELVKEKYGAALRSEVAQARISKQFNKAAVKSAILEAMRCQR